MGSFSEVVLSFDFTAQTPPGVLAAVAALAVPDARQEVPRLPSPTVEEWELFSPDWRQAGWPGGDPFEAEPWRHDWASWLSTSMGGGTVPHGRLVWSGWGDRWNLDCRFAWKTDPGSASDALAWLAPYVDPGFRSGRVLVGYAQYENAPRPHLFWVDAGRWELEDLNPDDSVW
ncbi:hypothetical protein Cch01nite_13780 [Cellulomonas chitinilytica]|uniref:Uncharacterized protein n=1 Tax=Cellulomonas chitinilytica TaxID=398759 RepID=A0A919P403_9CELL|nr:hypothetical protein [Cellulomonas chitinilytica]GIG20654.1 hypothetical protein Cch01nite_13780 [Cellulomonas chitinilytica]